MTQKISTPIIVLLSLMIASSICWAQKGIHTPPTGSAERQAIMDVMRLNFYRSDSREAHRNQKGVFFRVSYLKVHGDWALTCVLPVNSDNKEIAEPRWGLLYRKLHRWFDANYYDAIRSFPADDFDAIDMTPVAIRNIMRAFPDVPMDIFPKSSKCNK